MNNPSPKGWNAQAVQLWEQGNRRGAIDAVLTEINKASGPKPIDLVLQLAYYVFLHGDTAGAAGILKMGERDHPHHDELLRNLAAMQSRSGMYSEAIQTLQRLIPLAGDDPFAFDALCNCLFQTGKPDEASAAGTKALVLKDRAASRALTNWSLPPEPPHQWAKDKTRVVSYSLWGKEPCYLRGALDNALAVPKIYPGWTARFYVDDTVPAELLHTLDKLRADVRMQPSGHTNRQRLTWRFQVANDPDVGFFLVRDVDSVVNKREQQAVQAWLDSGRWFHVMRDWQTHTDLMLAGMWGGVAGVLPHMRQMLDAYKPPHMETPNIDQWFLRDCVWPYVKTSCLMHDRFFSMPGSQRWPEADPEGNVHVGQDVFAANKTEQAHRLTHWMEDLPCLGGDPS